MKIKAAVKIPDEESCEECAFSFERYPNRLNPGYFCEIFQTDIPDEKPCKECMILRNTTESSK